ncbi:hypothetical protein GE061_017669 [Apolygus lucorum]|uniref:Tubulin/FtsZ GTPase domain-containing protein n=1 Tax=Apolygus lucorum TaxID=248454 RepID=A0A8S9XEA8_APOLU|nr:hypothetical protein GE061_017669 [Apolygus lucorum]
MSEFITVQVGQCGNQIGQAFWPHALKEYGLIGNCDRKKPLPHHYYNSFFYNPDGLSFSSLEEMKKCNIKARALLVDMEDSVVERFQTCNLRHLFDKTCTLSSYPGSGNNWAVGHFTHGREQREMFLDMLQTSVEKCDSPGGFISTFSLSGGTGSGLGSAIVEMLADEYPRINRLVCCVHPGESQDVVTAPYNIALCLSKLKEHANVVIPVDNKVLFEMCSRLHMTKDMKCWKPYRNINTVIVKHLLNVTSCARFPGSTNMSIRDLTTTMVPFQGLHFLASSMSPISLVNAEDIPVNQRQTNVLADLCFKSNQLMSVAPLKGVVNSISLLARGDITPAALSTYASKVRSKVKWAGWSSQETKTAYCKKPPHDHPRSLTCLSNTDSMGYFFENTLANFYTLYRKKAHVHHYTGVDGFDDSFLRCVENLRDIIDKYDLHQAAVDLPRRKIVR